MQAENRTKRKKKERFPPENGKRSFRDAAGTPGRGGRAARRRGGYSYSIVPVGLGVRSYRTRFTPGTSDVMRETILRSTG